MSILKKKRKQQQQHKLIYSYLSGRSFIHHYLVGSDHIFERNKIRKNLNDV